VGWDEFEPCAERVVIRKAYKFKVFGRAVKKTQITLRMLYGVFEKL
jgi:hypothetical protein